MSDIQYISISICRPFFEAEYILINWNERSLNHNCFNINYIIKELKQINYIFNKVIKSTNMKKRSSFKKKTNMKKFKWLVTRKGERKLER